MAEKTHNYHQGRSWSPSHVSYFPSFFNTRFLISLNFRGLNKQFTIYSGRLKCTNGGVTITAGLDVTAETTIEMGAKYAYYFSGTIAPLGIIDTYVYVGAQPKVYAGVTIRGNAMLGYTSEVRRLIDSITYPGLSIKGIATVGPSLDLWGQIEARVIVSGQVKVGAEYSFEPVELYLPNNDATRDHATDKLNHFDKNEAGISPVFQANVRAELDAHLRITPQLNCGIEVGGRIGPVKETLVKAQVSAFMNTLIYFNLYVTAETNGLTSGWEYGYKVELLWRIGILAAASVCCNYRDWATKTYYPVDWQAIPLYGPVTVKSAGASDTKRTLDAEPWILSEEPLPNPIFGTYTTPLLLDPSTVGNEITSNNSIAPRQSASKESEFMLGDFKCTTGGGSACDIETTVTRREFDGGPSRIHKRAPTDCRLRIPNIYCK